VLSRFTGGPAKPARRPAERQQPGRAARERKTKFSVDHGQGPLCLPVAKRLLVGSGLADAQPVVRPCLGPRGLYFSGVTLAACAARSAKRLVSCSAVWPQAAPPSSPFFPASSVITFFFPRWAPRPANNRPRSCCFLPRCGGFVFTVPLPIPFFPGGVLREWFSDLQAAAGKPCPETCRMKPGNNSRFTILLAHPRGFFRPGVEQGSHPEKSSSLPPSSRYGPARLWSPPPPPPPPPT